MNTTTHSVHVITRNQGCVSSRSAKRENSDRPAFFDFFFLDFIGSVFKINILFCDSDSVIGYEGCYFSYVFTPGVTPKSCHFRFLQVDRFPVLFFSFTI